MLSGLLRRLFTLLAIAQVVLGARVIARLARTGRGERIEPADSAWQLRDAGRVSIIVPVLNERDRLGPCLDGLLAQGNEVAEILVVDGGSIDGTQALAAEYAQRDIRIQLIDASPIPDDWNGKAWGLQAGLEQADPSRTWVLTIDADVRPAAGLTRALLQHADASRLKVLSIATRQQVRGLWAGLLHPAMLTTLVYRFGIPGGRYRRVRDVQANGQCFLVRRTLLEQAGGFAAVRDEICEDVTLARLLVERGAEVGFFEAGKLVSVEMYPNATATWRGWSRSLPMRDRYWGASGVVGLAETLLVQALPIPLLLLHGRSMPAVSRTVNLSLAITRLGVLAGTARAYERKPWTYWLSPLADLPVALALIASAYRREQTWRGRKVTRR